MDILSYIQQKHSTDEQKKNIIWYGKYAMNMRIRARKRANLFPKTHTNKLLLQSIFRALILRTQMYQNIKGYHPVRGSPATVTASSGNRGIKNPPINTTPYANIKMLPYKSAPNVQMTIFLNVIIFFDNRDEQLP